MVSVAGSRKAHGWRSKLLAAALVGAGCLASVQAHATFTYTTSSFFTVASAGTFTFTFLGYNANDVDTMNFTFNGQKVFSNQITHGTSTPIGTQATISVSAAGTYPLTLQDANNGDTWSSNPANNSDSAPHLAETSTFSDFNIGTLPNVPGNSAPYFGWEDAPITQLTADYNDLVFTETFTPVATPEPVSLALLAGGLIGVGVFRRRR